MSAIDANGNCRTCPGVLFWGFVDHDPDCPNRDVMGTPADRARKEGLVQGFKQTYDLADSSDPRGDHGR